MKKLLFIFSLAFIFNSCDDGDFVVENFNFSDATIKKCNATSDIYVKTKQSELLLAIIPNEYIINEVTEIGSPRIYSVTSADQIIYRKYDGDVSLTSVCSTIPPATPSVTEEYTVLPGATVEVTTTISATVNETSLATSISYNHQITFRNLIFSNGDKSLNYSEYNFGTFKSTTNSLPFTFSTVNALNCTDNVIYKKTGNQVLLLDFDTDHYTNTVGTESINLNSTNAIISKLFNDTVDAITICSSATPEPSSLIEKWIADEGQVTIVTTEILDANNLIIGYKYAITFTNVIYKKGEISFTHPNYDFGSYDVYL